MPQLNPAPWFLILLFSWFIFLTFLPPKILNHVFPHAPSTLSTSKPKAKPWNWSWQ